MYATSFLLTSFLNSLIASKKGRDSISPTVPPISVIIISALLLAATRWILSLIYPVM